MDTLRKHVSDIANDLRSYNLDDRYSYRFLSSKLIGRTSNILKQDIQDRSLLLINDIWKELRCVKMEDSSFAACNILYEGDEVLKRSKHKIPKTYSTKYGNLIKVVNIKYGLEYNQIKPTQYKDKVNREFVNKNVRYFWILDDYIYVPDSSIEEVRALGVFLDSQEVDLFNGDIDCCYKPLDSIVTLPDYILDIAKQDVVNNLIRSKGIPMDESPDLNSNSK